MAPLTECDSISSTYSGESVGWSHAYLFFGSFLSGINVRIFVWFFNFNQELIWSNIVGMFGQILNIPPNLAQIENFYDTYKFNQEDLFCRNIFSWQNNVARLSGSRQKKFIKISHFLFFTFSEKLKLKCLYSHQTYDIQIFKPFIVFQRSLSDFSKKIVFFFWSVSHFKNHQELLLKLTIPMFIGFYTI